MGTACTAEARASGLPRDSEILVNVFNATWRNGLARQTAWSLASRNFSVGAVANDPWGAYVPGVAVVRFGPAGRFAAWAVTLHVPGALLVNDGRSSSTVDVVLGESFGQLADDATVRAARDAALSCSPAE